MTTSAHNNRASLLAGLRTGGVRSTSANIPHTAAPGGSFNVHHFAPTHNSSVFPEEEEDDQVFEMHRQNMFVNRAMPMTAAVDGPNNRFSYQQQGQRGMNPNSAPFSPAFQPNMMAQPQLAQTPSMQMQMLQLEMMRIQALQAQQYQAELLAQAQQAQQQQRRASFNPPATAGPLTNSFDLRAATLSAQMRRANQTGQLGSQLGQGADDHVPMTAALGGRFGSRTVSNNVPSNGRFTTNDYDDIPPTPNSTTVISGGTSLGNPASNNISSNSNNNNGPSKSDTASSWRRGGNNNSVLSGNNRIVSSPSVKVTPPNEDQRVSPPLAPSPIATSAPKFRPQPLHFSAAVSQPLPAVAVDHTTDDDTDAETQSQSSTSSGASNSSPTTPRSSASSNDMPLSPREEASKKLYEGLGIGRPLSAVQSEQSQQQYPTVSVPPHRMVSQPTRQPRGPPSGADELGPKNFATRIRRKAIGGLGMLMGARERREFIEAY